MMRELEGTGAAATPIRRAAGRGVGSGRGLAALGLAFGLAGCATSPDPHEGGFVSGVVGLTGGGYQRRVDERQQTYQGELDAGQRLKAQARELEQERAAVRGDLNRANARLAELERRLAQRRAALKVAGNSAEARRLAEAQARVTHTKGELRGLQPQEQSVADLRARSAAVNRDLDDIDRMVATVGGQGF